MAHVLVGNGDQIVERMVEQILDEEGHSVTRARSSAEILAVLRGSLHPLVVVLFFEGVTADDLPHLLETAWTDRDRWEPHAYILCAWRSVPHGSLLEKRIADLAIPVLSCPFSVEQLLAEVEVAQGHIGRRK
jgi:CheY-like chemotaxis protein